MAKLITRTFEGTRAEVLVFNKETNATEERECYLSGKFEDSEKLEKAVEKLLKNSNYRFVTILSSVDASELRGMSEEDFLKYSKLMDKETRKIVS